MSEIEWRDEFGRSQIGATYNQIIDFERSFGVRLPDQLRTGLMAADRAAVFKNGSVCQLVVTGPKASGGVVLANLQELEPLDRLPREINSLRAFFEDVYGHGFEEIIPFALYGEAGWLCLNYQNRPDPEVWVADQNGVTLPDSFYKVADSFDHLIEMLVSEDDLVRLGFG